MNEEVLEALEASIRHWEENLELARNKQQIDTKAKSCALCRLFFFEDFELEIRRSPEEICVGCPIMAKTGKAYCRKTPYVSACWTPTDVTAVEKELLFLRSLREDMLPRSGDRS